MKREKKNTHILAEWHNRNYLKELTHPTNVILNPGQRLEAWIVLLFVVCLQAKEIVGKKKNNFQLAGSGEKLQ